MTATSTIELPRKQANFQPYIGPATVVEVTEQGLLLDNDESRSWATMALGYRYEALPGDKMLVAAQGSEWYVIGVIQGRGKTSFVAGGDLSFSAPKGRIAFTSSESLDLQSGQVRIKTGNLEFVAEHAVEKYQELEQWVKGTVFTSAQKACHKIVETYRLKAGRIVERAKGDVKIDGEQIKLG